MSLSALIAAAPLNTGKQQRFTIRKAARCLAALFMLATGVGILTLTMSRDNAANRDFISYWAAGQQLVHRANPYDGPEVLRIERSAGFLGDRPFFMRNAPPALFLALPLGFVGPRVGAILWSLLIIGCLMASIRLLQAAQGHPPNGLHLIGYVFPPVLACILAGQTGIFVLFGLVLFLRFHVAKPAVAGAALLLCSLKPHLLLPLGLVLLIWAIVERRHRLLAWTLGAFLASCILAFWFDAHAWRDYAAMMQAADFRNEFIPTPALIFRLLIHRNATWLQFIPALIACRWGLSYFWGHRQQWDWMGHGHLLLLVSIAVAPYAWFTDQAVALPAMMGGLYLAERGRRSMLALMVLPGIALIEVLAGVQPNSPLYLWTSPAWIIWYLWAGARSGEPCRGDIPRTEQGMESIDGGCARI